MQDSPRGDPAQVAGPRRIGCPRVAPAHFRDACAAASAARSADPTGRSAPHDPLFAARPVPEGEKPNSATRPPREVPCAFPASRAGPLPSRQRAQGKRSRPCAGHWPTWRRRTPRLSARPSKPAACASWSERSRCGSRPGAGCCRRSTRAAGTRPMGKAAAGAATSWMRRLAAHAAVGDALAAGQVSPSWAREICDWSDLLPESVRPDADAILLAAAAAGAGLEDLAGLAEELRARTATPDRDGGDDGAGRSVRLDLHYRGAGRLRGDLTPRCAAALQAWLDALGKKAGPEDTRTRAQRDHDALEDALRRLIAAGCVPDRAGQPTKVQLHMTLDQLLDLQP